MLKKVGVVVKRDESKVRNELEISQELCSLYMTVDFEIQSVCNISILDCVQDWTIFGGRICFSLFKQNKKTEFETV